MMSDKCLKLIIPEYLNILNQCILCVIFPGVISTLHRHRWICCCGASSRPVPNTTENHIFRIIVHYNDGPKQRVGRGGGAHLRGPPDTAGPLPAGQPGAGRTRRPSWRWPPTPCGAAWRWRAVADFTVCCQYILM